MIRSKNMNNELLENESEKENVDSILIDFNNMFYRVRHIARYGDLNNRLNLTVHIVFNSILKLWNYFGPSQIVLCCDSKSWRSEIFENYRLARKLNRVKKSQKELEEDKNFFELYDELVDFFDKNTNFIVLREKLLEADDFISVWVRKFDKLKHVIASTDSDFVQLVNKNVMLFNYDKDRIIKHNGIFDRHGNVYKFTINRYGKIQIKEKGSFKDLPDKDWMDWALFCKTICGDVSDGILPIAPRLSLKKIREAFDDRHNQGYHWNNFMMTYIENEEGKKIRYIDKYKENLLLVNLKKLPEEIEYLAIEHIKTKLNESPKDIKHISFTFMKFCGIHFLEEISKNEQLWINVLSYNGIEKFKNEFEHSD